MPKDIKGVTIVYLNMRYRNYKSSTIIDFCNFFVNTYVTNFVSVTNLIKSK